MAWCCATGTQTLLHPFSFVGCWKMNEFLPLTCSSVLPDHCQSSNLKGFQMDMSGQEVLVDRTSNPNPSCQLHFCQAGCYCRDPGQQLQTARIVTIMMSIKYLNAYKNHHPDPSDVCHPVHTASIYPDLGDLYYAGFKNIRSCSKAQLSG